MNNNQIYPFLKNLGHIIKEKYDLKEIYFSDPEKYFIVRINIAPSIVFNWRLYYEKYLTESENEEMLLNFCIRELEIKLNEMKLRYGIT